MSKARLKKQLQGMTAEQMAAMVLELYDIRKEARDFLDYWSDPEPDKWLEKWKGDVRKVFYSAGTTSRRRPVLTTLNTLVKYFITLGMDSERTSDFLLYVAETECEWLEQRWRRLSYRTSMLKNLENCKLYIENAFPDEEENPFRVRLERLTERVDALFLWR